jgi:hypothetical protein
MTDNYENREPVETTIIPPDDVTAAEAATEAAQRLRDQAEATIAEQGIGLENFCSMRDLITQEEIGQAILGKPKGFTLRIGHIGGVITGFERRPSSLPVKPGEAPKDSLELKGDFTSMSYRSGEVKTSRACYLPRVMGEAIEQALLDGATNAQLDAEFYVEATGAAIPYRYGVTTFQATDRQKALKALQLRHVERLRARGEKELLSRIDPKRLEGPDKA